MRKWLKEQEVGLDPNFRYRGKNQTRVEAFSDSAFAIALALTVLSSSAPSTFDELWLSMREVIPFGLCVILVMVIWYQHYLYFLKYGLQNIRIIALNTFLIFLVLVYVYPLKFLFKVLFELYTGLITQDQEIFDVLFTDIIRLEDTQALMIIYGAGASLIFFTLAVMYLQALKYQKTLELDRYEIFDTKTGILTNILLGAIPFLSMLIAALDLFASNTFLVAGFTYMLYPPVMISYGFINERKKKELMKKLNLA